MERDSQYESFVNVAGAGAEPIDDGATTFDSMFTGISLLSLLGANQIAYSASMPLFTSTTELGYIPPLDYSPLPPLPPTTTTPESFDFFDSACSHGLFFPKPEPLGLEETTAIADSLLPIQLKDSFVPTRHRYQHHHHHTLPGLLSLERSNVTDDSFSSSHKRPRVDSASHYHHLPLLTASLPKPSPSAEVGSSSSSSSSIIPRGSFLARKRRQKLSEKTRCLQKLLPWDKKMDMATMLGEAYKYVKFLQAQMTALKAMPAVSSGGATMMQRTKGFDRCDLDNEFAELERLSRNQLLQVLVNSPAVQTMLYAQGCCVFSVEQLGLLEKVTAMRRMMRGSSNPLPHNLF